jgi:8-oxo-dGTP diphosphatase
MEFGETFEETVRREIREEYCVPVKSLKQIGVFNVLRDNGGVATHWVKVLFLVEISPKNVKIGEPEKMDEIGWFAINKLPKSLHSNTRRDLAVFKKLGIKI